MKSFLILLTAMCSVAVSAPLVKSGQFIVGFDRELNVVLTKKIQVLLDKAGVSEIQIEDEETLAAIVEDGKISAYISKPKKYFYYSLELNPKKQSNGSQNLIVRGHEKSASSLTYNTSYCSEGTTALLTAYVGDGTKKVFCTTLK